MFFTLVVLQYLVSKTKACSPLRFQQKSLLKSVLSVRCYRKFDEEVRMKPVIRPGGPRQVPKKGAT